MESLVYPPGYYDPPQEKSPCPVKGCIEGDIHGWDSEGSEVIEKCPHRVHFTESELAAVEGDRRYDELRDDGIL